MGNWRYHRLEIIAGIFAGFLLYLFLKYLFPLISPFFLSYLTIYALYPFLYKFESRYHVNKTFTTILFLLLMILLIVGGAGALLYFGSGNVTDMICDIRNGLMETKDEVHAFAMFFQTHFGIDGASLERYINKRIADMTYSLYTWAFTAMMRYSMSCIQVITPILAYAGVYVISTILFSKDFDRIMTKVHQYGALDVVMGGVEKILSTIGTYLKAQTLILGVIAALCVVVLTICKIPYSFVLGLLAGLLDALPFIGTGVVLIPTAIVMLLQGAYGKGVICVILYVGCIIVRELLEPRLLGKGLGIYPVFLLLSIYVGVKLFGIGGIILGPFGIVIYQTILYRIFERKS